jgi:hypothetical protein
VEDYKREEVKRQAKTILGSLSKESMKRRICDMFDDLREMKKKTDPKYEDFSEELRIWDNVYHDLKY